MSKVLDSLKRAIAALNSRPNFRTPEGIKSYELLAQLDKVVAQQPAARYEARIVENEETGSWYILVNEEGDAIEGDDAESVRAEALATLEARGYLPEPRLRVAKITTEYV